MQPTDVGHDLASEIYLTKPGR